MKKVLIFMMTALLLLTAGCALPIASAPTAGPSSPQPTPGTAPALPAETTTAAAPTQAPTEAVTEATQAPATEAPTVPSADGPTEPTPTEAVDPWSLMGKLSYEAGQYTDDLGNQYDYSYDLPCIQADTAGAQAINADIDRLFGAAVRDAHEAMEEGLSLYMLGIGWRGEVWEDVVTLVISTESDWGDSVYGIYCYEIGTGRWLRTPELLKRMGYSENDFLSRCREQFRQFFIDEYDEIPEDMRASYGYYEALERVTQPQFINMELQAYPDESGKLVVAAPIVSLAGADHYYYLIPLD